MGGGVSGGGYLVVEGKQREDTDMELPVTSRDVRSATGSGKSQLSSLCPALGSVLVERRDVPPRLLYLDTCPR